MLNRHYEDELGRLKVLAGEFARDNPALAPMLLGSSADPDVERLLEGVAFLTALLRQKLDDAFPEFIQDLTGLVLPHYLLPMPCSAMMAFRPRVDEGIALSIPRGTEVQSVPVDGTACRFRTCHDLEVPALRIVDCSLQGAPGRASAVRLRMQASGARQAPRLSGLHLFLDGSHAEACHLLLLLTRHVRRVHVRWSGAGTAADGEQVLPPECIRLAGFDHPLLEYPPHAFEGYRILQEYFAQPGKLLFVRLEDMPELPATTRSVDIDFEIDRVWPWIPEIRQHSLMLGVVPAVNLFEQDAEPIEVDHQRSEYLLVAQTPRPEHYRVHGIQRVIGLEHGRQQSRTWQPFHLYSGPDAPATPSYRSLLRPHPLHAAPQTVLCLNYPPGQPPRQEVLSVRLRCTNGSLPESLGRGDICRATGTTPDRVEFHNLQPPAPARSARIDADSMWRLQSHAALNFFSLADATTLRSMLSLYADGHTRGDGPEGAALEAANRRRIEGIEQVRCFPETMVAGPCSLLRGKRVRVGCRPDHFAGLGDMYLFGCVLEAFLADYAGINSYIRLEIEDLQSSEVTRWPPRTGTRTTL